MSSFSYTTSASQTFTITHARQLSAKVATDLRRIQRFYGAPSASRIDDYEKEMVAMLKAGYLDTVTYGFKRNDEWIEPTLRYTAQELMSSGTDDDPGKVRANKDITNASFYSFMTYSTKYHQASEAERSAALGELPFNRTTASEPGVSGYLEHDHNYSAGGRSLSRSTVRSFT
ncbi:hypothetical protein [Pseudomonas sp. PA27(2017)]|uniref:HORMA-1 domain-containing protein n=1 Tax=Pseudomonas sp. PA27(2017) TaxID=1932112 RepID=UPI00095F5E35|nr:hypothetical protein [Pseudomonas sp. PA27(2017)]OLU26463.1 hypothetical protein BVH06_19180 [Pseudomonas sp. PA27(2017)]